MAMRDTRPSADEWLARLPDSPDLYPQKLDLVRGPGTELGHG